jgi:hypothetical protein
MPKETGPWPGDIKSLLKRKERINFILIFECSVVSWTRDVYIYLYFEITKTARYRSPTRLVF